MRALAPPMHSASPFRVVIVGAGVTGLAAAHAIHRARPDARVTVLEAEGRAGGNIRTEHEAGFLVDAGPDSFIRTKPDALDLCRELGLDGELISTREAARHVYVAHKGHLELMPGGMALAVPTRVGPLLRTPLLGAAAKLRMLAEPFIRPKRSNADESIEAFFTRRLGARGARALAGPLLGGIYAGDVSRLSMRSTFPQLVELEEAHGSLLRGLFALEQSRGGLPPTSLLGWLRRGGEAQAPSPFLSFRGGAATLVDALLRRLPEGAVRLGAPVTSLGRGEDGLWHAEAGGERLTADHVILTAPAHVAARLVPDRALATELGSLEAVSTATVFFGLDAERVAHDLRGFGFIVPPGEAKILAATWVSSKWDGRAPEGGALVRAFVGGARDPDRVEQASDEELVALARSELERFMGPLGQARFARVYRYVKANPQPLVGHGARLARIRALEGKLPGLHLAGAAYESVGIPDCIRQGRAAAGAVISSAPASSGVVQR